MRKSLLIFLISAILALIFPACYQNSNSKNLDRWIGKYSYEEEPIKAIGGYYMTMKWTLSINKKNDISQGLLEVNGQHTYIKLLTDISGDTNFIALKFNKLIDGSDENLKEGDTLFILLSNGGNLKTRWVSLEPRLTDNPPKECNCFDMTQNNGH